MEFDRYLRELQDLIGYQFRDLSLLALALTAAGFEGNDKGNVEEQTKYDGNRPLAQLGESLLQTNILEKTLFEEKNPARRRANEALKSAAVKDHRVERAKRFQMHNNLRLNPRQKGQASPKTLSTAINAIFGACHRDCRDPSKVRSVIEAFGLGMDDEDYTDPMTIRNQQWMFGAAVTNNIFDEEPSIERSANITNFGATDMAIFQTTSWGMDMHRPSPTESANSVGIIPDTNDILEPFQGSSAFIIGDSFGDTIDRDRALEAAWDGVKEFPLSFEEPAVNSVAASSSSGTVVEIGEESHSDIQTTPSTRTGDLVSAPEDSNSRHQSQRIADHTGHQYSTERQVMVATGRALGKRKGPAPEKTRTNQLDAYVSRQKEYCQAHNLPSPEDGFNAIIGSQNTPNKLQDKITELRILYFAIASPEAVAALQAVVMVGRRDNISRSRAPEWKLSVSERMATIEDLADNMTHTAFIRRCHIHQLYKDSSVESPKTSDGFVINTAESMSSRSGSALGNPNNLDDARVSATIMREVYPDLEQGSKEYQRKLRHAKKIRKLGQRLDLLVRLWGYGILGLLPCAKDMPDVEPVLDITDSFILNLPDDIFNWFIHSFNRLYGTYLCKMSKAACEIVTAISRGTLDPLTRFGIENLDREDILQSPRGSQEIIRSLLSNPPALDQVAAVEKSICHGKSLRQKNKNRSKNP